MAVSFYVKVDEARFKSLIEQRGNQWAKSLDYTMRTMKRKAPTIVARNSAQVYNIAASRLNPNNKTASGSVSLSGGLTTLTLTYRGSKLPIHQFKGMKPRSISAPRKRPYVITGQVLKGSSARVGHWSPPHSEGGRYGAKSPWMMVPGVPGPVMRLGSTLGGTMRALSTPQMVVSDRTEAANVRQLNDAMATELVRQLNRFL